MRVVLILTALCLMGKKQTFLLHPHKGNYSTVIYIYMYLIQVRGIMYKKKQIH